METLYSEEKKYEAEDALGYYEFKSSDEYLLNPLHAEKLEKALEESFETITNSMQSLNQAIRDYKEIIIETTHNIHSPTNGL